MSRPRPFALVFDSPVSRLDFAGLLAALQELLGLEVDVTVYLPGASFAAGFHGRLLRVAELPPDREAVTLQFEGHEALTLAPEEVQGFCGLSWDEGEALRWVEAQIRRGPCVLIEEA
jgi:hypothetical protein